MTVATTPPSTGGNAAVTTDEVRRYQAAVIRRTGHRPTFDQARAALERRRAKERATQVGGHADPSDA